MVCYETTNAEFLSWFIQLDSFHMFIVLKQPVKVSDFERGRIYVSLSYYTSTEMHFDLAFAGNWVH